MLPPPATSRIASVSFARDILQQVALRAQTDSFQQCPVIVECRQQDGWNRQAPGFHFAQDFDAAHFRHSHVKGNVHAALNGDQYRK